MPDDPLLWIGVALLLAIVVIFVVSVGKNVFFDMSSGGLKFRTSDKKTGASAPGAKVRVAEGAEVDGEVGSIAGVTGPPPGPLGAVDVAKGAKIKGKVDRIVGISSEPDGQGG